MNMLTQNDLETTVDSPKSKQWHISMLQNPLLRWILFGIFACLSVFFVIPTFVGLAVIALVGILVRFSIDYISYSKSVGSSLVKQAMLAMASFLVLLWFTFICISFYTRHGEEFALPNFSDMTLDEAKQLIEDKGLRCQILDSVYTSNKKPGTVVDQIPPAQCNVKKDRIVYLTIKAITAEQVRIPNFVGTSVTQAEANLETAGLVLGKIEYIPDIAKNYVLRQKWNGKAVAEGTLVPKGAEIVLVVGQGLNGEMSASPYLIGMTKDAALREVAEASLNIGATIYDESVKTRKDSIMAKIWKQNPPYSGDSTIAIGSFIDIWLTLENKAELDTNNTE